ncbi:hypothetical protein [Gordonia humi]|uniref:Uncharacterized protein n=1 Tax=Gordonia humi TaxID=686429 RepID=A0A840EXJ8_9ACTN|nr:hypothetical protein [Gordonia humi]MBB4135013.1 hypothetical protein [Gordonia humi]
MNEAGEKADELHELSPLPMLLDENERRQATRDAIAQEQRDRRR